MQLCGPGCLPSIVWLVLSLQMLEAQYQVLQTFQGLPTLSCGNSVVWLSNHQGIRGDKADNWSTSMRKPAKAEVVSKTDIQIAKT